MKILYITPSRIGDTVLSTGALQYFLKNFKFVKVTIATPALTAPLFTDLKGLEQLIIFEKLPYKKHWWNLYRLVSGQNWDVVIDMRGSIISYGMVTKKRLIWKQKKTQELHKVLQIKQFLKENGISHIPNPQLWLSQATLDKAKAIIGNYPTIAVAPAANWIGKQWVVENFTKLLQKFLNVFENSKVAIFAAPHEESSIKFLLEQLPKHRLINCINTNYSLLDVAACIKHAKLFIGNDSGLMHISASIGTKTIGLFGPSNEKVYGPWPLADNVTIKSPQILKNTTNDPNFCYMDDLTVDKVWETVKDTWQK